MISLSWTLQTRAHPAAPAMSMRSNGGNRMAEMQRFQRRIGPGNARRLNACCYIERRHRCGLTSGWTTPGLEQVVVLPGTPPRVCRLIQALFSSLPAPDAKYTWHEEAHFAAPPKLAPMRPHWGLARDLRVSRGCPFTCQGSGDSPEKALGLSTSSTRRLCSTISMLSLIKVCPYHPSRTQKSETRL
jgi:hypothetical protein